MHRLLPIAALTLLGLLALPAVTAAATSSRAAALPLPLVGFNATGTSLFILDVATARRGTAFYYYQGEPYYALAAGPLPYTQAGTIVSVSGVLNPTGDPHADRQMQWRGAANLANGSITIGGWDPLTANGDEIVATAAPGDRRRAEFVAQTGFQ